MKIYETLTLYVINIWKGKFSFVATSSQKRRSKHTYFMYFLSLSLTAFRNH